MQVSLNLMHIRVVSVLSMPWEVTGVFHLGHLGHITGKVLAVIDPEKNDVSSLGF